MSAALLSQLFVQVTSKGVAGASAEMKALNAQMKEVHKITGLAEKAIDGGQKMIQMMGAAARIAVVPLAAMSATLIGLTAAGLAGTVQMYQLQFQFQLLTREIAGAMLPVVQALIDGMKMLWTFLQRVGLTGQNAFLLLGVGVLSLTAGFTAMITVLGVASAALAFFMAMAFPLAGIVMLVSTAIGLLVAGFVAIVALSPNLRAAFGRLFEAMGRLYSAIEPILAGLMRIGGAIADAFIVTPLIQFIDKLVIVIGHIERLIQLAKFLSPALAALGMIGGAGGPGANQRRAVALNQTGEETGQGTFQRIQEAILRMSQQENDPQLNELRGIRKAVEKLGEKNAAPPQPGPVNPAPLAFGQNEALNAAMGPLGALFKPNNNPMQV